MKIAQIMPNFGLAGAERMCENLIYGLLAYKQSVFVISLYDFHSIITDRLERNGVKIYYLKKKQGFDLSIFRKISQVLKMEKPDIIHTHRYTMEYVIPIASLMKIPVKIHTIHTIASKEQNAMQRKLSYVFFHFQRVIPISLSPEIQKTVMKEYRIKSCDTPIIFNGIDLNQFKTKKNYDLIGKVRIHHIGRCTEIKNHLLMIEAAEVLRNENIDFEMCFTGENDFPYGVKAKQVVIQKRLNDYVRFLGPSDAINEVLQNADIFILPSIYEGIPITLIEAMASGLPIIASSVGGIVDMLTHEIDAILINPNVNELVDSIKLLIADLELRKKIGENAYERSRAFSLQQMTENYLSIYSLHLENFKSEN